MATLRGLLESKRAEIVGRWLDETLAAYPEGTAAFLRRERDPFANPAGRALREGTAGIFESLLGGVEAETICRHLDGILGIRAVQHFSPSQAVAFVFLLKNAIRAELEEALSDLVLRPEWAEFEARIDQVALFAFDIFARRREQVYELRVNEVKRSIPHFLRNAGRSKPQIPDSREIPALENPMAETENEGCD